MSKVLLPSQRYLPNAVCNGMLRGAVKYPYKDLRKASETAQKRLRVEDADNTSR